MPDLDDKDSALTVKIAGADATGLETNYANVDVNGNLKTINNNGTGSSAVNVQDGGNSITVDTTQLAATLGQKNMAGSAAVVIASDQSTLPISAASLPLPAGAATSALQTTGNTSLGTIVTNTGTTATNTGTTATNTGNTNTSIQSSQGTVAAGTAATKSTLVGGVFNTALPTLTTGQQAAVQLDSSGRPIIAPLTNASIVKAQLQDNSGNGITSASNGTAGNQLVHTQVPDTITGSTALGALNAAISIQMAGLASVGFQLAAGTLIGTITPQCSIDGGTTWENTAFFNPTTSSVQNSVTFASANPLTILSLLTIGGTSHARVVVTARTSGTANAVLRASTSVGVVGAVTSAAFSTVTNNYVSLTANAAVQILAANVNRKYAYISNNSGSLIVIQFGSATGLTSAARGLVIPNNTFYELRGDNLYTGAIFAYTNASGIVVAVTEGTP